MTTTLEKLASDSEHHGSGMGYTEPGRNFPGLRHKGSLLGACKAANMMFIPKEDGGYLLATIFPTMGPFVAHTATPRGVNYRLRNPT